MKTDVWLEGDEAAGDGFFRDVSRMVEAVTRHSGTALEIVSSEATRVHCACAPDVAGLLEPCVGIHRAQLAPPDGKPGRIVTAKVTVALGDANARQIIRTHNYPLEVIVDHRTGARIALAAVLAGRA